MPRRHIPKEYKEIALKMSLTHHTSDSEIKKCTGISKRALKRLRKTFRETGDVIRMPICSGRPRLLSALDANVVYPVFANSFCGQWITIIWNLPWVFILTNILSTRTVILVFSLLTGVLASPPISAMIPRGLRTVWNLNLLLQTVERTIGFSLAGCLPRCIELQDCGL